MIAAQKSVTKWTKEEWRTKSGNNSTLGAKATGERYLPKKAPIVKSQKQAISIALSQAGVPRKGKKK